jgi:hypothetical protein
VVAGGAGDTTTCGAAFANAAIYVTCQPAIGVPAADVLVKRRPPPAVNKEKQQRWPIEMLLVAGFG